MTTKKTRTRAEAKRLMWEYYKANRKIMPKNVASLREEIIDSLKDGTDPRCVFDSLIVCPETPIEVNKLPTRN